MATPTPMGRSLFSCCILPISLNRLKDCSYYTGLFALCQRAGETLGRLCKFLTERRFRYTINHKEPPKRGPA